MRRRAPAGSPDIDLFHDAQEAMAAGWEADRTQLQDAGLEVSPVRERPGFVEAVVGQGTDRVLAQWAADSAFRFFPLLEHADFVLTLHPFDLATNKVLALVGRLEVRDWIDVIASHERIQPLGYLARAACGKDPGFSPASILDHAGRTARYSEPEVSALSFDGPGPSVEALSRTWHAMLAEAREVEALLPPEHAGCCVLGTHDDLFRGGRAELEAALATGAIRFRSGSLRGVLPTLRDVESPATA